MILFFCVKNDDNNTETFHEKNGKNILLKFN